MDRAGRHTARDAVRETCLGLRTALFAAVSASVRKKRGAGFQANEKRRAAGRVKLRGARFQGSDARRLKKFKKSRETVSVRAEPKSPKGGENLRRCACRDGKIPPGVGPMFGRCITDQERSQRRIAAQKAKTDALIGPFVVEDATAAIARLLRLLPGTLLEARLASQGEVDRAPAFRDLETRASKRNRLKLEKHRLRPAGLPRMANEKQAT